MHVMVNNLQNKPILGDKLLFCFSIRANEGSRERDMEKTEQIIGALKRNGFHLNNPTYGYTFIEKIKVLLRMITVMYILKRYMIISCH